MNSLLGLQYPLQRLLRLVNLTGVGLFIVTLLPVTLHVTLHGSLRTYAVGISLLTVWSDANEPEAWVF